MVRQARPASANTRFALDLPIIVEAGSLMAEKALVTGFEPYAGHRLNPSAKLAAALDGAEIAGHVVVGRCIPVAFAGLAKHIDTMLAEVEPTLVIALGLHPGESMIRLERFGVNLADFAIPDNAGVRLRNTPVEPGGAAK